MKKVTKILMVVALAAFSFNSFAQTFGVQAGLNLASAKGKQGGEDMKDYTKMIIGFNVGGTVEFPLSDAFAVQSGLILNTKGVKIEVDEDGYKYENKSTVTYLDIPINAKYSLDLGGNKLYFAAGPYVAFALKGKYDVEQSDGVDTYSASGDLEIGSDEEKDDLKRMDFGLNIGAGMEFGAIGVGVQYGLGLTNLTPGGDSDNSQKNRLISISLAYKFGK